MCWRVSFKVEVLCLFIGASDSVLFRAGSGAMCQSIGKQAGFSQGWSAVLVPWGIGLRLQGCRERGQLPEQR